ncbi:hypothetical protein NR798_04680 [Archangium gephyra]|uniref:hypothetical protein n=1 Tax=Archangium gephyra TaxID=48 RepID=UPI0035D425EF
MYLGRVDTDFNGLVLFDPSALRQHYGGRIREGTDLFTRYVSTEEGDEVLSKGLIVPVLAIDDAGYDIAVRLASEPHAPPGEVLVENGKYPLRVVEHLVVADLLVLKEWSNKFESWKETGIGPGVYAVTVRGFRNIAMKGRKRQIVQAGYEFVLEPKRKLPKVSADTGMDMKVLRLD